tara:strand:+ start:851 stop:1270 length:420 start_codon:yes stop_codon:yes gene_type:complete
MSVLHDSVLSEFEKHTVRLREASRNRKNALAYTNLVDDHEDREAINIEDTLGKRQPSDIYNGDVNLRTLRTLLKMVDERGWERSAHQMMFHSSFERCVSRVLYKGEWETSKPAIMKHNLWDKCNSEVMISTPVSPGLIA